MSKSHPEEQLAVDHLKTINNSHLKKLRFHPYYYQGRKGSLYIEDKRSIVKITKIDKQDEELVLTLSGKKHDNRLQLKCYWDNIEFDYYSIKNTPTWKIVFPKK